jgi:hypothetical protein
MNLYLFFMLCKCVANNRCEKAVVHLQVMLARNKFVRVLHMKTHETVTARKFARLITLFLIQSECWDMVPSNTSITLV